MTPMALPQTPAPRGPSRGDLQAEASWCQASLGSWLSAATLIQSPGLSRMQTPPLHPAPRDLCLFPLPVRHITLLGLGLKQHSLIQLVIPGLSNFGGVQSVPCRSVR